MFSCVVAAGAARETRHELKYLYTASPPTQCHSWRFQTLETEVAGDRAILHQTLSGSGHGEVLVSLSGEAGLRQDR